MKKIILSILLLGLTSISFASAPTYRLQVTPDPELDWVVNYISADNVSVDSAVFGSNLSAADNSVQKALETLDGLVAVGGGDNVTVNGVAIDTTANFLDRANLRWGTIDGGAGGPDSVTAWVPVSKDLVTTSPLSGGTDDIFPGDDSDIVLYNIISKDLVVPAPLYGSTDDVFLGVDSDLTVWLSVSKDVVPIAPLYGGADDILPGADSDVIIWQAISKDIAPTSPLMINGGDDILPGSDSDLVMYVVISKDVVCTSPITVNAGTNVDDILPGADSDITIAIADAAADGATKGAATFNADDFDAAAGVISIDNTNFDLADIPGGVAGANVFDFGGATSVEVPNSAAPTVDATGKIGIDTDLITQGMLQIYLTSAIANIVATTDTPGDNEVPTYDAAGGTIQWEAGGAGAGGGDPVLVNTTAVTDAAGVDLTSGTYVTVTLNEVPSPDTATFEAVPDTIAGAISAGAYANDSINDDDINWADLLYLTTDGAGVDEAFAAGWNSDVGPAEKDDIYDWGIVFDSDADGLVDGLDTGAVDATTEIAADMVGSTHFEHSKDWGDVATDASGNVLLDGDCVDENHIADNGIDSEHYNDGSIDHVHLGTDIITGAAARTAFESGDTLLINEAGVGLREIDYDDLPAGASDTFADFAIDGADQSAIAPTFDFDGTNFSIVEDPANDFDINIALAKDLVAGVGLSGGSDNVLVGADGDITLTFDATELTDLTWSAGTTFDWNFNVSAGTDPVIQFRDGAINVSAGTLQVGGNAVYAVGTKVGDADTLDTHDTAYFAVALGEDDNYVTDAEKTVIGNTSGANTGDNTVATSGDSATAFFSSGTIEHEYGGLEADISGYTGMIGNTGGSTFCQTLADTQIIIGDGAGVPTSAALSGDATMANDGTVTVVWGNVGAGELGNDSVINEDIDDDGNFTFTGIWNFGGGTLEMPNSASDFAYSNTGEFGYNATDDQIEIEAGDVGEIIGEFAISGLRHLTASFAPDAICDGAVDRVFLFTVGKDSPEGITITEWEISFEADPTTEVDLDLKRCTAFIGVGGAAVMDILDTTAGVATEYTASNINGGAVVAYGQDIYLEFGTAYTETTHQVIFQMWFYNEAD